MQTLFFAIKLKKSTTNLQYISWENSSDSSMNSFIVFMAILSLVATIYFFILIGTVVPIEAVLNLAQGADILESGKSTLRIKKKYPLWCKWRILWRRVLFSVY